MGASILIPPIVVAAVVEEKQDFYRNVNLNEGWTFRLNDQTNEQVIDLPHDFSIIQDFDNSIRSLKHNQTSGSTAFLPGGVGYYHKDFILPERKNPTVILNFDGAYNDTTVTVNGHIVGNNKYGYNPFAFDISDYVVADGQTVNKLDVIVKHEFITSSRWYPGSGIYRDVNISILDKVHVAHNGTYVTTPYLEQEVGKDVTVNVEVDVQNSHDGKRNVQVQNRVVDAQGKPVTGWIKSTRQNIKSNETNTFKTTLKVNNPKLWSAETPNLYYVETQVVSGGNVVDQYKTRFGFRYYKFDKSGFRVNGKLTKLQGVCLHHDQGALGAASYNDAMYRQLCIMKEMGMNAVRTSHNCPDQDFLRMCDELGMYVMDEAFDGWEFSKTTNDFGATWKEEVGFGNNLIDATPNMQWHSFVMRSMVKRDRNCPSIFMWSCGNELHEGKWHDDDITDEEREQIGNEMVGFAVELKAIARELDHDPNTKRWCGTALESDPNEYPGPHPDPLEYAHDWPKCRVARTLYEDDGVIGLNYGDEARTEETLKQFDRVYGSETASANNSRGFYGEIAFDSKNPDSHFRVSSYDSQGTDVASEVIWRTLNYDGYGGQFVWTGFDYLGEPSPFCWNCEDPSVPWEEVFKKWPYPNSAYYGIVDTCGFAKDSYYLYRANLRHDDTTLHLVGSLNENNMYKYPAGSDAEGFTPVDIYTNAPYTLIKRDGVTVAAITRKPVNTSRGNGFYYIYDVDVKQSTYCKAITLPDTAHNIYTRVAIDPTNVKSITAEAYESEGGQRISNPVGLSPLVHMNKDTKGHIETNVDKTTLKADGKSLAYITVDLKDDGHNLITDLDAQKQVDITWFGAGQVLGVDNGDQATDKKFQNPEIYRIDGQNHAKIYTYAGKALIIVCSDKTPGEITLNIDDQIIKINVVQ
ncbi:MAG: glycoside hydrolase family 2 protein [Mycoplasma sp.]|nr:glycoside hydrolase family 2 protein [Candidatus Hennigella equi]